MSTPRPSSSRKPNTVSAYYDHHPLVHLDRHLVLAGYVSSDTRKIGYQLAALTGLGVMDLERTIEHFAGMSIPKLMHTEGEVHYRRLERKHLRRLLDGQPRGIITLGDGTLIDSTNRQWVLGETKLVVLDLDLPSCYWRLRRGATEDMDHWHPLYAETLERFEQVRPFHQLRQPGFAEAPQRIDLGRHGRGAAVDQLMALIA